jgi:arginine N-succinyltransferase
MLDEEAKKVIGVPHPSGRAAMRMLENEGFAAEGYVDIFDGGPTMTARTDNVKSIAASTPSRVSATDLDSGERALIAAGTLGTFRSAYGMREIADDGSVVIDAACAELLEVSEGDEVWSVAR